MKRLSIALLMILVTAPFAYLADDYNTLLDEDETAESTSQTYFVRLVDPSIPQISAGQGFACSLHLDTVKCWGYGGTGHLGYGDINSQTSPQLVQFGNMQYATDISAGSDHACAVMNDNSLYCWGQGQSGRLGSGNSDNYDAPNIVNFNNRFGLSNIAQDVESGYSRTCSILVWGNISCWGSNTYGGLGLGIGSLSGDRLDPYEVSSLGVGRTAVDLSMGYWFSCALLDDGSVSCWGHNAYGQLGDADPNLVSKDIPTNIYPFGNNQTAVEISSGMYHTCAILTNGSVSCWGKNNYGQIGVGSIGGLFNRPVFVSDFGVFNATKIIAGHYSTCAILNNSETHCWGSDDNNYFSPYPVKLDHDSRFIMSGLALSNNHHCSIFTNGYATCWGIGGHGQFGDGTNTIRRENISLDFSDRILISEVTDTAVEGLNTSFRIEGDLFDGFNPSNTSFTIDMPNGVNFNPFNQTIYGAPNYTSQTSWDISLGTGNDQRNGTYQLQILADTDSDGIPNTIDTDDDGDGFGDPSDACPTQYGNSTVDLSGCPDNDGDGYSNSGDAFVNDDSQQLDTDQDGFGDNTSGFRGDYCPLVYGESTRNDVLGCPDSDFDGWADFQDLFVSDSSQWNDTDLDGFGDELNGFRGDACPLDAGNSTADRFGCLDSDGDGYSDLGDDLPYEQTQWSDRDGDGYGDNNGQGANMVDNFPSDGTQWNDTDGDGHGDNPYGSQGDWFPNDPNRWQDSDQDGVANEDDAFPNNPTQSVDSDGDGYGDDPNGTDYDDFPLDANEWLDTDSDGIGDNSDQYPYDPSQSVDSDGDGFGDNTNGTRGDAFPEDGSEWLDTDGDGVGDNSDDLPFNPSQTSDADGDGFGDDPTGTGADPFLNDPTQWVDADGDGYGDNAEGNNPDLFPRDITQWFDSDGDGFGDNQNGVNPDAFPDDSTQWIDDDGDGFGDNPNGTNPDPSINDYDNDGYLDNDDPFPQISSPGDKDNDGVLDENDAFPDNFREFADNDGDGDGDIEDLDDDNDGYLDEDEIRSDSDPLDQNSQPVEGFEIIVPGTAISLGAWDLIGIFGGVPLFGWIGFGFLTRNKRCAKYEEQLKTATTRDELEKVALRWEYSLMLRMLGPHQGIRLERLRAELDDKFENATYDETEIGYDQTNLVENEGKDIPLINDSFAGPTKETAATSTDDSGYEWFKKGEENWYRPIGSEDEWLKFED